VNTKIPFPRVREAREALKEKALELYEAYMDLAKTAKDQGDFVVAETILWKLIEHMPNEDGTRMIDASASKPIVKEGPAMPAIQIAVALGGINTPKALNPVVVDITDDPDPDKP
jgi:hypothetical protein